MHNKSLDPEGAEDLCGENKAPTQEPLGELGPWPGERPHSIPWTLPLRRALTDVASQNLGEAVG